MSFAIRDQIHLEVAGVVDSDDGGAKSAFLTGVSNKLDGIVEQLKKSRQEPGNYLRQNVSTALCDFERTLEKFKCFRSQTDVSDLAKLTQVCSLDSVELSSSSDDDLGEKVSEVGKKILVVEKQADEAYEFDKLYRAANRFSPKLPAIELRDQLRPPSSACVLM